MAPTVQVFDDRQGTHTHIRMSHIVYVYIYICFILLCHLVIILEDTKNLYNTSIHLYPILKVVQYEILLGVFSKKLLEEVALSFFRGICFYFTSQINIDQVCEKERISLVV